HGFRQQHRALEDLHVASDPDAVGDLHIARGVDALAARHVDDRMLVAGADENVGREHTVGADVDARRLVDQQIGALDGGVGADADVLAAGVAQVDLARAVTGARADLDEVVLAVETDLAVTDLHAFTKDQAVVAAADLDGDLLHQPRGAVRNHHGVAGLDVPAVAIAEVVQPEIKALEHGQSLLRIFSTMAVVELFSTSPSTRTSPP